MLKIRLTDDMKNAMKSGDKPRLAAIRLMIAAIKQREVDERVELNDAQVSSVLNKMLKQRRDSVKQYADAGRDDLVAKEQAEMKVIKAYLPEVLAEDAIQHIVSQAIKETHALSIQDMGKVMSKVKLETQGRADMAIVSATVKKSLT